MACLLLIFCRFLEVFTKYQADVAPSTQPVSKKTKQEGPKSPDFMKELMKVEHRPTSLATNSNIPAEFREYCAEAITQEEPLQFWKRNARRFPVLAAMARDYLAAPASSASSERLFSAAGNFLTPKRNRLSPSTRLPP
jgi:hypothetical protein